MTGMSVCPSSLSEYSVRTGVSGITSRLTSPAASISFKLDDKTFWLMPGMARPVAEGEQRAWIDRIFEEQPYLGNVYPGDTREIGIVFEVRDIALDYFNLGVKPIERATFSLGEASAPLKGCCITDSCIGCGTCLRSFPQKCIVPGDTYRIEASHCLHCGACAQVCPVGAVERL